MLDQIVDEIKENKKENIEIKNKSVNNFLSSIIVIDDLCSTKQMFLNKKFLYLMKTIRHHDCLLMLLT